MILHEFGKALPDQVTPERLSEAYSRVAAIQELDPSSIDSLKLAEKLQGLSRAISDIVLAQGSIRVMQLAGVPNYDPTTIPEMYADNVLQHFDDTEKRVGRMFIAQPSKGYGASMAVDHVGICDQRALYEAQIPTDQMIDELLMQEPILWDNMAAFSQDFRNGQPVQSYPFHSVFYNESAPAQYLGTVQELSSELLAISSQG